MKYKRSIAILFILILLTTLVAQKASAQDLPAEIDINQELRGVWLTPITGELSQYTSEAQFKSDMEDMFLILEHYHINTLFFHVRTHNNALYDSSSNPIASWFTNVDFQTFDPLEWLISESKLRGIEFHAWMNPYRVDASYYGEGLPASNPASNASNLLSYNGKDILNPGLPLVRDFVIDTVLELVENYDVDAIHFDDYFYINLGANGATSGTTTILDESDQDTFELYSGSYNINSATDKADWRRDQINLLVSGVKSALNNYNTLNNDFVQFGISPTGIYKNGNGVVTYDVNGAPISNGSNTGGQTHYSSYLFSDSLKWISEGWVDYLTPQSYWATNHPSASYPNVMGWWNDVNQYLDVNIYSGIGVYMANSSYQTYNWKSDPNEFINQINLLDTYENISGASIYSYNYLESAYNNLSSMATTQINNVKASKWNGIAILPELKSMNKVIIDEDFEHTLSPSYISWNRLTDAKNYYIFASDQPLLYTTSEIVGVVGQQVTSSIQYEMSINPDYYYAILPISNTNTIGTPSVLSGVRMLPGASIRTSGTQGLKYQASYTSSMLASERGFFVIYGETTLTELLAVIDDEVMIINEKEVYKTNNYDLTSEIISVVLTGIPSTAYAQKITVFAYAYDGSSYTFVPSGITRNVGEVALKAAQQGYEETVADVLNELKTNYYTHYIDEFGDYRMSTMYETDRVILRTNFLEDWNAMFLTNWTTIDGSTFHNHANAGALGPGDLSGSRIYQFFNNPLMSDKWGWLLDYLKSQDEIVWPTRQILAIQGDGTLEGQPNLYHGIHLDYSIVNFFNNTHEVSGYNAIDFTGKARYADIDIYNESIYIADVDISYNNVITYNLNGGDFYEYTSRTEVIDSFIQDFNSFTGKTLNASNFYNSTYHASENYVIDFFNSTEYSGKWIWLKNYILERGSINSYALQGELVNDTASAWRSNIWGFLNESQRTSWPVSIDFSNSDNANSFWPLIKKSAQLTYSEDQEHFLEIPFKLGNTFSGWYENSDFSGVAIISIPSSSNGAKAYYAKWD